MSMLWRRLTASQKQLAECPEHEALQTIVVARNANGGIRNCCQSWELLDVGKPSDGQKPTGRDEALPSPRPPSSNVSNHCGQFQGRADDTAYCKGRKEEGDEDDRDADVDKPFPRHCMTLQGGMMTAVDVRRPNSHHVVRGRILCERLKVTPRERIKVSRCTNVCHLLQGGLEEDTEDFSLWKFCLIRSLAVPSDKLGS